MRGVSLFVVGVLTAVGLQVQATPMASAEPVAVTPSSEVMERPDLQSAQMLARSAGREVEVTDLRSQTNTFWVNPEGGVRQEASLKPVRFLDALGKWQAYDLALTSREDGTLVAAAHDVPVTLPSSASGVTRLPTWAGLITMTHPGANAAVGDVVGNVATYREALSGRDLRVQATLSGFEESMIVPRAGLAGSFTSRFTLPAGMSARQAGNYVEFVDAKKQVVSVYGGGRAFDAQAQLRAEAAVAATLVTVVGRTATVTAAVSPAWLADPARVFPVTIDPDYSLHAKPSTAQVPNRDTYLDQALNAGHPTAPELYMGSLQANVYRSLLWFDVSAVQDPSTVVSNATLRLYNTFSVACQAEAVQVRGLAGPFGDATTWSNQPSADSYGLVASAKYAHGGAPGVCDSAWASHNVTTLVQRWASGTQPNHGMVVQNDVAPVGYKRFSSGEASPTLAPVLDITYNHRPGEPWNRTTSPAAQCKTGNARPSFATTTPTFNAATADRDRGTTRSGFQISPLGSPTVVTASGFGQFVPAGTQSSWAVPAGVLSNGSTYMWKAKGFDHVDASSTWTDWCEFTVDTTDPAAPTVTSTAFPAGAWTGAHGQTGSFSYAANGSSDVAGYQASLDTPNQWLYRTAPSLGAGVTVTLNPAEGPHTLYLRSFDRAGNRSPITTYAFNVGQGGIIDPAIGTRTRDSFTLTAAARPTYTAMTWQWRRGSAQAWTTATGLTTPAGVPLTQPLMLSAGLSPTVSWTPTGLTDGPVEIRATFTGPGGSVDSQIRSVTLDRSDFSSAAEQVGPGSVTLRSGNYQLSDSDVRVDAYGSDLTVTRTFNSRAAAAGGNGPFGPGWVASTPVETAGSDYRSLTVAGSVATVTLEDGDTLTFAAQADGSWAPEIGAEARTLSYASAADRYDLTDLDGNVTGFTRPAGSASYVPSTVLQAGDGAATQYAYEVVTVAGEPVTRVTTVLAPVPAGVSCALNNLPVRGCRSLSFDYAPAATSPPAAGSTGDYPARLRQVSLTAWDPQAAAMATVPLAAYDYQTDGRLARVWDPRLPALKTSYGYGPEGQVVTLQPPGEQPWTFSYASLPSDATSGRLRAVSRPTLDPSHPTAVSTVVYNVPVAGAGAPYDLSPAQLDRTGQADRPVTATAVFPPSQEPTGTVDILPGSYEWAAVHYLDSNGREVNEATNSGGISTTEYDQWGHTSRTLTPANRQRALDQGGNTADEAVIADLLSSGMFYLSNGIDMWGAVGPEHTALLTTASGSSSRQRTVTLNTFNENAPGGGPYHLVTTSITKGSALGDTTDYDQRTTKTQYGTTTASWTLGLPTAVTTDPAGLALTRGHSYTSDGRVLTDTLPSGGTSTSTAATRKTVYYTAGTNPDDASCGNHPEWANLVCATGPAAQPTGTPLPTSYTSYDLFNQPRVTTETAPGGVTLRVTTMQYDSAARLSRTSIATPGIASDTDVPTTEVGYDPATGRLTRTSSLDVGGSVTASLLRSYDTLGRMTGYTDADGQISTTSYDYQSRPVTTSDGKGTQTRHYDEGTERRGLVTRLVDSHAGTWTASYDLDTTPTVDWPNGLRQTTTVDETGAAVKTSYVKTGCTGDDCTWLSNETQENTHGQVVRADGLSEQAFGYDKAGRLTGAIDQQSPDCTGRSYSYDANSNRTAEATYRAAPNGLCQLTTPTSSETHNYDQADRITDAGYSVDALGRTLAVPDSDTLDLASSTGTVSIGYHANDLVRSISQGAGPASTYTLDVAQSRIRSTLSAATGKLNHYNDDTDAPAWWTTGASTWTRAIGGIAGGLAATYDSTTGAATLQLANLHGDVVATATTSPTATALTATFEATEFGIPRSTVSAAPRYSWLGKAERATDNPAGITLMGVRLYNPASGRFLQTDPIKGGNANDYDYCTADPINCVDLDGRFGWKKWIKRATTVLSVAGMMGCAVCAGAAAGLSVATGLWDVYHDHDNNGWWDVAGGGLYGAGKAFRYGNQAYKKSKMGHLPKGGKTARANKRARQNEAARHRSFNRNVTNRVDRADTLYGYYNLGLYGYSCRRNGC